MSEREHIIKSLAERDIENEYSTLDVPLDVFADHYDELADWHENDAIEHLRELYADAFPVDEEEPEQDITDVEEINRFIDWMNDAERRPGEVSSCGRFIRLPQDSANDNEVSFA
jgi:hypothetical protein